MTIRSHFHPLSLKGAAPAEARQIRATFAVAALALLTVVLPEAFAHRVLGGIQDADQRDLVPMLSFLVGSLCMGFGVWAAVRTARGTRLERAGLILLGLIGAALVGGVLRYDVQVEILRQFYGPWRGFGGARLAAFFWGLVLTVALSLGFGAPAVVAAVNLLPRFLTTRIRVLRWLLRQHGWLVLPFPALALAAIITQWVLPNRLADAMGYLYPGSTGASLLSSLHGLGADAWISLNRLAFLPLIIGIWSGAELARTCHRLAGRRAPTSWGRLDYRPIVGVAAAAAVGLGVLTGHPAEGAAGVGLLGIALLSMRGVLPHLIRLPWDWKGLVKNWELPEEWTEAAPMGLLLLTLVAPALLLFGGDIYRGLESLATIWRDEFGFTRFWSTYGVFQVSDITVSGIFGHGEYLLGGLSAVFAALTWAGLLLGWKGSSRKDRKSAMKFSWFLLRVALLAWLFMLLLPAVDHSYSVLLLAADAILICAFLVDRESRPAVVRAIASASILLVLWGLFIWHSAWLPPFALLLFDIFQRFVWDATALNVQDRWHSNRLAFFQGLILLSLAVLVLDHGAVHAYFATDEFSKVSDRVGISVISMLWLVQLVVAEIRQTTGARIAGEGAPVSAA